jgi:two-component system, NarL family, sensor histidine kinase DegS
MTDTIYDNPTDELLGIINHEITALKQRLQEINSQIDQYEHMVRREEQRNTDVATTLQVMRDNIETMPREDIQLRYDEAMDVRFRLATMRGQLDQYKATRDLIQEERQLLSDILARVQGGIELSEAEDDTSEATASSLNLVRIIQAQEDERRRLANQIHDGPAQSLTNFVLQAEIVQRMFDRDQETAKEELQNLKESASLTFQRVRDFISDLRPMMLDDLGVIPTARRYIEAFSNKSDITVNEEIFGGEDRRLERYQEVMLFRGLQDLMAHARDFADANEIDVRMDISADRANITVTDNGRTFDAEEGLSSEHTDDPRAAGILMLRERFKLINGDVTVSGGEGEHTQVRIEMPINEQ